MEYEAFVDNDEWKEFEQCIDTCITFSGCLLFVVFIAYLLMHVHT